jgi:hypothetical protein
MMEAEKALKHIQQHLTAAQSSLNEAQKIMLELNPPPSNIGRMIARYPKFKMFMRQDKGEEFERALVQAGYESSHDWRHANFILADHDQRGDIRRMQRDNKKFFIHPHSARSFVLWDGILPTTSFVQCNFVFAPGAKKVMQLYGYRRPIEVVGWTYCPIKPFTPSKEVKRVLFAPIHPNRGVDAKGRHLMHIDVELNRMTYEVLCSLPIELTVRYGGDLQDNGLKEKPGVNFEAADMTMLGALRAMEGYDVIIGHQTFAYLAIASGIPTVMFGEETMPHSMHVAVRSWQRYKNLLMFPLDILNGDPMSVLEQAASSDEKIQLWKEDFIGVPFEPTKFVQTLEKYLV